MERCALRRKDVPKRHIKLMLLDVPQLDPNREFPEYQLGFQNNVDEIKPVLQICYPFSEKIDMVLSYVS